MNVTNSSYTPWFPIRVTTDAAILIGVSTLICVTGCLANILIAVVILKVKKMQTTTNWLVFNLAIADLTIVFITIPYNLINPYISWPFGYVGCKYLIMPTMEHFASVCVLTHTAISLVRYVNIRHSNIGDAVSQKVVIITIFCIWTVSFLVLSAPLMGLLGAFDLQQTPQKRLECQLHWIADSRRKAYRVCVFILTYIVPMIATGISYRMTHHLVHESLRRVQSLLTDKCLCTRRRKSRQMDSTLMLMYSLFALLTLPLQLFLLLFDFDAVGNFDQLPVALRKSVFDVLVTLFYAQILSNPFILLCKAQEYRKALRFLSSVFCSTFTSANTLVVSEESFFRHRVIIDESGIRSDSEQSSELKITDKKGTRKLIGRRVRIDSGSHGNREHSNTLMTLFEESIRKKVEHRVKTDGTGTNSDCEDDTC